MLVNAIGFGDFQNVVQDLTGETIEIPTRESRCWVEPS